MAHRFVTELLTAVALSVDAKDNALIDEWAADHDPGGRNSTHAAVVAVAKFFTSWLRHYGNDCVAERRR